MRLVSNRPPVLLVDSPRPRACPGGLTDSALAVLQNAHAQSPTAEHQIETNAVLDESSERSATLGKVDGTAERVYYFGRVAILSVLAVALLASGVFAEQKLAPPGPDSWPSFRNGNAQLGIAKTKLPEKLELLWTFKTGQMVTATAAIVGDSVYAASLSGELYCLAKETGKVQWTYKSRNDTKPNEFIPGFKSAPTVTSDTVYIGDEEGLFHAVDRATGKAKWTFPTKGEIVGSATLYEDKVILGSHDNSLYCLKASDGSKVWQFVTENMVNCSPAISGNCTFIAGCDEHLRAIEIPTRKQVSDIPLGTYLIASPAVIGDILYVGSYAGEVVAMNWRTKHRVWTYKPANKDFPIHSSAAVNDDVVIVGGQDKQLHCINRKTGEKVWIFKARAKINSSPVIVGERVFVGSDDGNLYGLQLKDGTEVFRFTDGRPFSASPAIGEEVLVIGSENDSGPIYCFGKKNASPPAQK